MFKKKRLNKKIEFKINRVDLLTPIAANKFSAELYSSIDYRLKYSGAPSTDYVKDKNQLVFTGALSASLGMNESEHNISYAILNVGKRSLEFVIASEGIDSVDVNIFYFTK